jgi:hypothetical protein
MPMKRVRSFREWSLDTIGALKTLQKHKGVRTKSWRFFERFVTRFYEYSKLAAATMESTLTLGRTVSIRNARPPRGWVSWNVVHFDLLGLLGLTGSVAVAGSGYKA